jgi:ribosomal-protein-alanine N-acetyltransferase
MEITDLADVAILDRLSFNLPWPESSFKFEIENNPVSRCWVAEVEGEGGPIIVGMIVIWLIVDEAHVATFAIHPDYRRMHIGRRLLSFTLIDAYHSGLFVPFWKSAAAIRQHETFTPISATARLVSESTITKTMARTQL